MGERRRPAGAGCPGIWQIIHAFLSTVQIGITLVGILAGVFGVLTIADRLAVYLDQVPFLAPYSRPLSLIIVVVCITYLSLVIGELVPKRLALYHPERIASAVAGPMRTVSVIAYPVVRLLTNSTGTRAAPAGHPSQSEPPVTEEEINMLIGQGAQAGIFEDAEPEARARGLQAGRPGRGGSCHDPAPLYRPWSDLDEPPEYNQRLIGESPHSRFPVCRGGLDNVTGMVHTKDLLVGCLAGQTFDLGATCSRRCSSREAPRPCNCSNSSSSQASTSPACGR